MAAEGRSPDLSFQSIGLTPAASTRTASSPSAGLASGMSISSRTSGPPNWVYAIAVAMSAPTSLPDALFHVSLFGTESQQIPSCLYSLSNY